MTTATWKDRQGRYYRVQYEAEVYDAYKLRYRCDLQDPTSAFYPTVEEAQAVAIGNGRIEWVNDLRA